MLSLWKWYVCKIDWGRILNSLFLTENMTNYTINLERKLHSNTNRFLWNHILLLPISLCVETHMHMKWHFISCKLIQTFPKNLQWPQALWRCCFANSRVILLYIYFCCRHSVKDIYWVCIISIFIVLATSLVHRYYRA